VASTAPQRAPASAWLRVLIAVSLVAGLALTSLAHTQFNAYALGPNAVRPGFNSNTLPRNDDGFTGLVSTGLSLNFFGNTYTHLYVNNNGNVTFDLPLATFTPFNLTTTGRVIIAPFFGDVDTRNLATDAVTYSFGAGSVDGRHAFGVNWLDVGYYNQRADKLNNLQLVLIDRSDIAPGDFDIEFNYDRIQWETGDASGGFNGLGGSSARAGFSNGTGAPGTSFELPGSAVNGAFLDSNLTTGLIHNSLNSTQLGRYLFQVRNGVVVVNEPPVVAADNATVTIDEGQTANTTGAVTDADGDTVALTASIGAVVNNGDDTWSWSFGATDGPTESQTVTISGDDGEGGQDSTTFDLVVNNVAPTVGDITPSTTLAVVGTEVTANASYTDPGTADTHEATWSWGDGSSDTSAATGGASSGSHTYTTPGVYTVTLTVEDDDDGSDTATYQYVVVYDPSAGFVTGGGWIDSPAGAYAADPLLAGRANFGFVSKYRRGATVPDGNTQFQFKAGNLNFHSTSYQWLVVAGARAQFKGVGTINGAGEYGFMLTAIDGQINSGSGGFDKFRIKIWDIDTEAVIYDNQPGGADDASPTTTLGGGSIVIHN
jgi:hypothetical protein